ncbi:GntR family transcriptional regulator [Propionivibrio limicola]|uniref:GntR family transcriptional regulator n=1 Tax=Propionivibrio limicola TaxID=167645 RepID=UPI001291511D|nr:GntR family transcriptional regulator [Propionivibrio limicola]
MPRAISSSRSGSLTSRVTDRLRRAILDAELGLGEALSEDKLATALGVSRTPVRDALTALQVQGLIDIRPQRGSYVFMPTRQDVAELCEFRTILEVQAIALSSTRHKQATLALLRQSIDEMEAAKAANDFLAVAHADTDFHASFVENSGNKYLIEAYRVSSGRFVALRSHVLLAVGDVRTRSMSEHWAIVNAFEQGNIAEAEAVLTEHIAKALDAFDLALEHGLLTKPYTSLSESGLTLQIDD